MKRLWTELRERHVVKVAVAYLLVAWLVLQLADIIFPALTLPAWSITLTLGLLIVGFPVALVLAWVFDWTPRGIEHTDTVRGATAAGPEPPAADYSIAVLPLSDMSAERDQEHFCDGLTEELLNVLTCIPNLRVASRSSSFAFKNKAADIATVADKLHVGYVLEGSVRKDGSKVRITAQLVDVSTDAHLWSEKYDRELCDIFAIQDDIAGRILEALKLKLGAAGLPDATTQNAKAYEYYLRGRGYFFSKTRKDTERAMEMLRKAVELDPGFVRGWISLAEVSAMAKLFLDDREAAAIAVEASDRAMALAPNRADSFMASGFANLAAQRFAAARADFCRTLDLDGRRVEAWHYLARASLHEGRTEKAREYFTIATDLDPEDWESPLLVIGLYRADGDMAGARRMARLGVERAERHLQDYPDSPRPYYLSLAALELLGQPARAREYASRALEVAAGDGPTRYNLACFYARTGETDRALELLDGSVASRSWAENDPDLDTLRDHPRYRAIVEAMPH